MTRLNKPRRQYRQSLPELVRVALCGLLLASAAARTAWSQASLASSPAGRWTGSWASAQQVPEPANALPPADLPDATLRQIVHLSLGGSEFRVHLSNAFGTEPVRFASVHVATPVSASDSRVVPGSDRAITFSGATAVTVPAGAEYLSDPVAMPVSKLQDLAISIYLPAVPAAQTGHPGSRATSYLTHGDKTAVAKWEDARPFRHWYFLSAVDVLAPARSEAVVAFGDSITDGHGATENGNDRWPDVLARRVAGDGTGVLNAGIGGNHLLTDGLGPNALARFDRDVLARDGVRAVVLLEGINDLGALSRREEQTPEQHKELVQAMTAAYTQLITRAHAANLRIAGATLTPYVGSEYYHPTAANEADRQEINTFLRSSAGFDCVIDFDRVLRDPAHPDRMQTQFDSGDHLHPGPAGYRAMGEAVPLSCLDPGSLGTRTKARH